MSQISWIKQAYLTLIPAVPIGYLVIHGFRGDQIWTKLYVNRSTMPAPDSLKQLVEAELDHLVDVRHPQTSVVLTNELEPKNYGGFFLNKGTELQFPLRVAIEDAEQARRFGSNLEMDLGNPKYRRKIEANSGVGDELIARLMLSDNAKRFIIQRQLQLANNGVFFCVPVIAWMGFSAAGYLIFTGISAVLGGVVALISTTSLVVLAYTQFISGFKAHMLKRADEVAVNQGSDYLQGARDYFISGLKFNRLMRAVLGEEGERNIEKNGDIKTDPVPYSERLEHFLLLWNQSLG